MPLINCKSYKKLKKTNENEFRYFLKSVIVGVNRLFTLVYLNSDNDVKQFTTRGYYLAKGIIKNIKVIINGKNFMTKQ